MVDQLISDREFDLPIYLVYVALKQNKLDLSQKNRNFCKERNSKQNETMLFSGSNTYLIFFNVTKIVIVSKRNPVRTALCSENSIWGNLLRYPCLEDKAMSIPICNYMIILWLVLANIHILDITEKIIKWLL